MIFKYISYVHLGSSSAQSRQVESMIEAFSKIYESFQYIGPKSSKKVDNCKFLNTFLPEGNLAKIEFSLRSLPYIKKSSFVYSRDALIIIFSFLLNRPSIYELHKEPTFLGRVVIFFHKRFKFFNLNKNLNFCVISFALREYLVKKFEINEELILVSHDGGKINNYKKNEIDLSRLFNDQFTPETIILHSGSVGFGRGIELFRYILEKFKNLGILHIGGSKLDIDNLKNEEWIKSFSDRFILKSNMDQEILFKYQSSADLLIFPMTEQVKTYWCCSPLKIFDYMSSGRNIICSDIGTMREILDEEEAFFFEPSSKKSLLDATSKAIFDSDIRGKRARTKLISQYTWDHRAEKIKKFIVINEN